MYADNLRLLLLSTCMIMQVKYWFLNKILLNDNRATIDEEKYLKRALFKRIRNFTKKQRLCFLFKR